MYGEHVYRSYTTANLGVSVTPAHNTPYASYQGVVMRQEVCPQIV